MINFESGVELMLVHTQFNTGIDSRENIEAVEEPSPISQGVTSSGRLQDLETQLLLQI